MLRKLEQRCFDISYKNGLSHLSSVLGSLEMINHIYQNKKKKDKLVLGNSHAALALFVVLEKHGLGDAEKLAKKHGTHANRDIGHDIWVSGGSLGQVETVAVGMALADKARDIYLVTSDGACAEGSIWEALRIAGERRIENLKVVVIANGYSALGKVDVDLLDTRLNMFYPTLVARVDLFRFPGWLQGIDGHYVVMNEGQYQEVKWKEGGSE